MTVSILLSTSGERTDKFKLVEPLAPNATNNASTTMTIPTNLTPGTYHIGAIADYANQAPESNEANNTLKGNTITIN